MDKELKESDILEKPETSSEINLETAPEEIKEYVNRLRKEAEKKRIRAEGRLEQYDIELTKLKEQIKKAEEEKLEEKNQYKELYENTKKEKLDLELAHKSISDKLTNYEQIYEAERLELLGKLPEDMQEAFQSSDKKQLQILLSQLQKSNNSAGAQNKNSADNYDYESMSHEERLELNEKNPTKFKEIMTKYFENLRK